MREEGSGPRAERKEMKKAAEKVGKEKRVCEGGG